MIEFLRSLVPASAVLTDDLVLEVRVRGGLRFDSLTAALDVVKAGEACGFRFGFVADGPNKYVVDVDGWRCRREIVPCEIL